MVSALRPVLVEKVWGCEQLPAPLAHLEHGSTRVGELWFEDEDPDSPLLVKYLFTSERLSVQVHPDDAQAKAIGLPRGKNEAWIIVAAEPDATIALGFRDPISPEGARDAALSGEIENLLDWRSVKAGDVLHAPAGTIHAIGGGITLIEIQQSCDVTYRLYDYGRLRELHLFEALTAAKLEPAPPPSPPEPLGAGRQLVVRDRAFQVERWTGKLAGWIKAATGLVLVIPIRGSVSMNRQAFKAGEVARCDARASISMTEDAQALVAYPKTADQVGAPVIEIASIA